MSAAPSPELARIGRIRQASGIMKPIPMRTELQEARWFIRILVLLALLAIAGAINEWLTPSAPPFKGRFSWMIEVVLALAGTTGLVGLWLLAAVACAAIARFVWRHTARLPTDRLLW